MKNKGFTLVEMIISLVILVAIGLVIGTGLNKVFDNNTDNDYEAIVNKVISSADVYLTNNTIMLNELSSERGYVVIKVTDLINDNLLEPDLVNPKTGEKLGSTKQDEFVRATLDAHGVLKLTYPTEEVTESYLEAQNKLVEFKTPFACENIDSYAAEWGTTALRLINKNGTVNTTASIKDVIKSISCEADLSKPGNGKIVYNYVLPDSGVSKELTRTLIVSPDMSDITTLTATVNPTKVAINNPVYITVSATNRRGETRVLNASEYVVSSSATNVAGKFTPTITYNKENSDKTKPSTTVTYEVIDDITKLIDDDSACAKQADGTCWYIGDTNGNHLSYSGKTWRIFRKEKNGAIALILNNVTGARYAFTNHNDSWYCSPSSCCNSSMSLDSSSSSYLLSQNPNGLNTYLNNTFLNTLTNHATFVDTTVFDISGYGVSTKSSITQKVGLLSYAEYSKIATCSTFSCRSSYLNTSNVWGLGTYYRTGVTYGQTYNLAEGNFNRYVSPRYNVSLAVASNGNVSQSNGSFSLSRRSGGTITSSAGEQLNVKPVIVLKTGTKITGGNGTAANPYKVG